MRKKRLETDAGILSIIFLIPIRSHKKMISHVYQMQTREKNADGWWPRKRSQVFDIRQLFSFILKKSKSIRLADWTEQLKLPSHFVYPIKHTYSDLCLLWLSQAWLCFILKTAQNCRYNRNLKAIIIKICHLQCHIEKRFRIRERRFEPRWVQCSFIRCQKTVLGAFFPASPIRSYQIRVSLFQFMVDESRIVSKFHFGFMFDELLFPILDSILACLWNQLPPNNRFRYFKDASTNEAIYRQVLDAEVHQSDIGIFISWIRFDWKDSKVQKDTNIRIKNVYPSCLTKLSKTYSELPLEKVKKVEKFTRGFHWYTLSESVTAKSQIGHRITYPAHSEQHTRCMQGFNNNERRLIWHTTQAEAFRSFASSSWTLHNSTSRL